MTNKKETGVEMMNRIGNNVASTWGACCEKWEILKNGKIRFYCNECGEKFCTDLNPSELQEYNY